jgi:hypothetical protein
MPSPRCCAAPAPKKQQTGARPPVFSFHSLDTLGPATGETDNGLASATAQEAAKLSSVSHDAELAQAAGELERLVSTGEVDLAVSMMDRLEARAEEVVAEERMFEVTFTAAGSLGAS